MTLLQASHLKKVFAGRSSLFGRSAPVHAVDDVSMTIERGEILALVGESGSGKSTTGRLILRLTDATDGELAFEDHRLDLRIPADKTYRKNVQIIFQDSRASLNPRRTIFRILADPMLLHGLATPANARTQVSQLLERVGLAPAQLFIDRHPRQFSGGQLQRIGIARALALRPKLIVADEPVSALDSLIRAQILDLLLSLRVSDGLALLFITHDLAVVRHIADRVAVMYLGRIVETGPVETIFARPAHPYTQALLSATPVPDPRRARQRIILRGDIPDPTAIPEGCRFHPRCPRVMEVCKSLDPRINQIDGDVSTACHLYLGAGAPQSLPPGRTVPA